MLTNNWQKSTDNMPQELKDWTVEFLRSLEPSKTKTKTTSIVYLKILLEREVGIYVPKPVLYCLLKDQGFDLSKTNGAILGGINVNVSRKKLEARYGAIKVSKYNDKTNDKYRPDLYKIWQKLNQESFGENY